MSTITFKTTVQDGIIKIPDEYQQDLGKTEIVEVTIVSKKKTANTGIIAALIKNPILVENFKPLTREEAHERDL
jgi:hypothetical protein